MGAVAQKTKGRLTRFGTYEVPSSNPDNTWEEEKADWLVAMHLILEELKATSQLYDDFDSALEEYVRAVENCP